ncbi:nonribosomal peptide synthase [Cordyceps javanica]|uniref:Nonribosomal peptide synthase n=1 Tax=Cordyceps javanica TaxID=43265 RepID=A0A545VEY3_9HYPO|nr:nonribosomal peptide synthase [Cordyceps javanica]TQW11481.1 nonribosomal peptide synthase [Cordyceps javanica]
MAGEPGMEPKPKCIGDGKLQQTLAFEIDPDALSSVPVALQLAWLAVLGCYTGSDTVNFDIRLVDNENAGGNRLPTGGTISFHLEKNESVQLAMSSLSQLNPQLEGKPSDTLLVLFAAVAGDLSTSKLYCHAYSQYQLAVECCMNVDRISIRAVYKDSAWPSATIYFMLHQIQHAVHLIATSSKAPVSALQSISAEGLKQLMNWGPAPLRGRSPKTVWCAIEKRCKEHPLQMAIESWDGHATYGELEQRVSAVAEKLAQSKLQPGTFIGLLVEKSMMATVAILGVIKAGYAFVLLDGSQPAQRLRAMCITTAVATIVATPKNMALASSLGLVCYSTESFPCLPSADVSHMQPRPNSPLYVGFTSGSTGEPKGFILQHDNFVSGLEEYCTELSLSHDSRVFQYASYSFVVSITGQLAPLSRGACLCMPSQSQLENDLAGAIRDLRANWVAITPSAARILDPGDVSCLQTVVMVGEEMSSSDQAKWSHLNLYSLYGQSENSKGTMVAKKTGENTVGGIGKPYYANAWIVDREDHNVLLPVGAEGELVIESPCLTEQYVNNADQTEAAFFRNPKWMKLVGRGDNISLFKTGDLARRNATDGSFHFIGRKGTRTKIRGQRVELGEIEHQIRRLLPCSRSAVVGIVCTAEDKLGQSPMLVAFVLMNEGLGTRMEASLLLTPSTAFQKQSMLLDKQLKDVLPSFMVPTAYVELAVLPKTSTGKLDRRRLREAAASLGRRELIRYLISRAPYKEPGCESEAVIRDICEQILQLPRGEVGVNDTFVDLGGDSLLARHLITRARSRGLSITLQELFQPATLAQIAQNSAARKKGELSSKAGSPDDFIPLRQEFISKLPDSIGEYDVEEVLPTLETQAAYASNRVVDCFPLHVSGSVRVSRLRGACQALVARHAILRTVFHFFRGNLVQVVLRQIDVPFLEQTCDDWGAAVDWVREYGSQELKKRYDIGKPIVGFVLVSVPSEDRHILVMRLCHGQYDALCLRPLIQDLWVAYRGRPLVVKAEFTAHVLGCSRQRMPQAYEVWRSVLQGAEPSPLFQRVPAADDEATLSLTTMQLPEVRPLAGVTPASMIKAAWFEALWRETGQDDLVFGQFLHAWTGNDGVIGPCMNVVPVRVRRSQGQTRRHIVQGIQSQHAATASAQALGWSDIIANCTNWPAATEVDSVVLHQNFDRNIEVISDGIICRKEMPMLSHWAVFPLLLVTHPRESRLDALLLMSSRYRVAATIQQEMAGYMGQHITLCDDVE